MLKPSVPPARPPIVLLSHLRWIAALAVVMSHIEQDILQKHSHAIPGAPVFEGLSRKPLFEPHGYGHAAVVVFFVLSGFLVGGKLSELIASRNFEQDWRRFLIDRFARIFVVLWPALGLTAIVCIGLVLWVPNAPFVNASHYTFDLNAPVTADLSATRWLGAALLLNEIVVPTLDSNGPLWSLAYEWLYYILGLSAVLLARRRGGGLMIVYAVVLSLLAALNQPDILVSGLIWLAGWLARIVFDRQLLKGRFSFAAGLAGVAFILLLNARHPTADPYLGIALAFMISHASWARMRWQESMGHRLAGFSYSLYAVHFPLLLAIMGVLFGLGIPRLPFNLPGLATGLAVLVLLIILARIFAFFTEDRTAWLKKIITRLWLKDRDRAPGRAPG